MSEAIYKEPLSYFFKGYIDIETVEMIGMINVRADLSSPLFKTAIQKLFNCFPPAIREICIKDNFCLAWMSPDEMLILCPDEETVALRHALRDALHSKHSLVEDTSDMRICFKLEGAKSAEVLAKLCPVDLFSKKGHKNKVLRTRLAQIPVAFWQADDEIYYLICFRSHAQYAFDVLCHASAPESQVF